VQGAWGPLLIAGVIINWLIPFLVLLSRPAKRRKSTLVKIAILLLVGRWLDLYILVEPTFMTKNPDFGLVEIAPMACALALVIYFVLKSLGRHSLVPVGDPHIEESLAHHT